ncbi:MAG: hypothetical protein H7256_08385 [Bdellovibrio sp.]|nr:hypothetical protein [Bdellovibrio sp.]
MKTIFGLIFITGLFVFFQNCSVQQNAGILGSKSTAATAEETITAATPFAYDLAPDTISYNSCVGENLNNSGLHGLKIGVNEGFVTSDGSGAVKGGLKLRTDFLQYVGLNVPSRYPSTVITPAQIQYLLTQSKANKDAYIQFAVRRRSDLAVMSDLIQPASLTQLSIPRDGFFNTAALNQDPVLTNLTKNVQFGEKGVILSEGARIYSLTSDVTPTPIQVSFGFSNIVDETFGRQGLSLDTEDYGIGERYSELVRNRFNLATDDKYLLSVTFGSASGTGTDLGLNSLRRKDDTVKAKAYGRSYALGFSTFATTTANGWKNNSLKTVKEYDLASSAEVGSTWSCSSYVIMKQNQWNGTRMNKPSCSPLVASDLAVTTIGNAVKKLRRHYLESDWNIGLFYDANQVYTPGTRSSQPLCLVSKNNECYLSTENVIPGADVGVNYNPLTECYLYNRISTTYVGSLANVKAAGRCAQFASICTRSGEN